MSPIAGLIADRFHRRAVILVSLGAAALASVGLALVVHQDQTTPAYILACSFTIGSAFSIYAPARLAVLPGLVPDEFVFNASTVSYSGTRLMGFFGPVLGGFLLDDVGVVGALIVQAALFCVASGLYVRATVGVENASTDSGGQSGVLGGIIDAAAYLKTDRALQALMVVALIIVPIGMPYLKLMPVFVREVLDSGPQMLGLITGIASLGAALSGLLIAAIGESYRKGYAILVCSVFFGLGLLLFSFIRHPLLAVGLALIVGIFSGVFLTLTNVSLLTQSPDELRGRMMSVWGMVWGVVPFTSLLGGGAADQWGMPPVLAVAGIAIALACAAMLLRKSELLALQ